MTMALAPVLAVVLAGTYVPHEGDIPVARDVFRHIAPFVKKGAKVLKVDGMKDG